MAVPQKRKLSDNEESNTKKVRSWTRTLDKELYVTQSTSGSVNSAATFSALSDKHFDYFCIRVYWSVNDDFEGEADKLYQSWGAAKKRAWEIYELMLSHYELHYESVGLHAICRTHNASDYWQLKMSPFRDNPRLSSINALITVKKLEIIEDSVFLNN